MDMAAHDTSRAQPQRPPGARRPAASAVRLRFAAVRATRN
jgi:hypothetical protein